MSFAIRDFFKKNEDNINFKKTDVKKYFRQGKDIAFVLKKYQRKIKNFSVCRDNLYSISKSCNQYVFVK